MTLSGYKTYIVAALMLVLGGLDLFGIHIDALGSYEGGNLIMEALAFAGLRKGISG